jgi:hypothetical protein
MQHSEKSPLELARARAAIEGMRNANTLNEFEEHWKEFLRRLERVWSKAENHFGQNPKWNGWKGQFESLRKTDPLLSYLVNARGADEHTINEILRKEPGNIQISPAEGNVLHVERLVSTPEHFFFKSPQPVKILFFPGKTTLLPVTNRGRHYPVPITHLNNPIDPTNVIAIAETAVQFYQDFLSQAEKAFVK